MPVVKDIESDIKTAKKMRLPWWGVLCVFVGSLFVAWLFDSLGRFNLALPLLNGFFTVGFVVALKWKLRTQPWFWIAVIGMAGVLAALILNIPWTTNWVPASAIAGVDTLGFLVMLTVLDAVNAFITRRNADQ